MTDGNDISNERVLFGLFCSALFGSALIAVYVAIATVSLVMGFAAFVFGLMVAMPSAFVIGIPVFLFLRSRIRLRAIYSMLTGGFIAAVPYPAYMASVGISYGVPIADILAMIPFVVVLFAVGAASGLLFWWTVTRPRRGPSPV